MDPRAGAAALRSVAKSVHALNRIPSKAAAVAAPKLATLIQDEFDRGEDPYGDPWAELAESTIDKGRQPPPLTDTERLRTVDVKPSSGSGIEITLGADYAAFHQIGTRDMPARPPLPNHGLPKSWQEAIAQAVGEQLP